MDDRVYAECVLLIIKIAHRYMLKLNLQIEWIRLTYHNLPNKNHAIHLILQNQQAEQLTFQRKMISIEQNLYFLDTLSPFHFHMIVGQNKPILCPFRLSLVSKHTPPITRVVPFRHADIFQHYLNHQLFAEIEPMHQCFPFQEGELVYKINFGQSQTVKDVTEVEDLHKRLKKTQSMISEIKIKVSQISTQQPLISQQSKLKEIQQNQDPSLTHTTAQMLKIQSKPVRRLKSYHSMSEMTISQIAESLQNQRQKRYIQMQKQSKMYETEKWFLKLGKQDDHQANHEQRQGWSLKAKLLVALLILGFLLLSYITVRGGNNSNSSIKLRKKIKIQKKAIPQYGDDR